MLINKKNIIEIISILALIYVNAFGIVGTIICGIVLLFWGVLRVENIFKAFLMVSIVALLHPNVLSGGLPVLLRYLITFVFFGRLLLHKFRSGELKLQQNTVRFGAFIGLILLFSVAGLLPLVSVLKLLLLYIVVFIFFESVMYTNQGLGEFMFHTFLAIIIGSWFIYDQHVFVEQWKVYQSGSSGIFSHPQTFGIISAVIFVYFMVRFIDERKYFFVIMALLTGILIVLSEARTALLSAVIAIGLAYLIFNSSLIESMRKILKMPGVLLASVVGLIFIISYSEVITNGVVEFVKKNQKMDSVSIIESYNKSRGDLIEKSLTAFSASPLIGSGFGLTFPIEEGRLVRSEWLWNMPISYSVEPGNLYIAFFAEAGILGGIALFILIGFLFWSIYQKREPILMAIFITILLVNLAEACLLAPNGVGGVFMGFIAWAQMRSKEKKPHKNKIPYQSMTNSYMT
ncbi:MAG: O-antigen ligase family protein [Bacteroidetes Order II. Incertae sedis bacterium]|nr:O-antigen ligase family protein [Bacteroidetes Order II. bacterium]